VIIFINEMRSLCIDFLAGVITRYVEDGYFSASSDMSGFENQTVRVIWREDPGVRVPPVYRESSPESESSHNDRDSDPDWVPRVRQQGKCLQTFL
jgi:hypothetical protein